MLTADQYVASTVDKYRVIPDTESLRHCAADEIAALLKEWGNKHLLGITLSGAYAENTAITLTSDVDVLVALSPVLNMEMKNIFWSLFERVTERNMPARAHDVSIRARWKDLNMDLIPACRECGSSGDLLFHKRSGTAIQTDMARHVHLIANSGRQQEICALKIWRERKGLDFPSFYLELTTLRALENERFGRLSHNIHTVLRYLANRFERVAVRDPPNSDNIVSNDIEGTDKKIIADAARDALCEGNWQKFIW